MQWPNLHTSVAEKVADENISDQKIASLNLIEKCSYTEVENEI